jgi:hypothetical protein
MQKAIYTFVVLMANIVLLTNFLQVHLQEEVFKAIHTKKPQSN